MVNFLGHISLTCRTCSISPTLKRVLKAFINTRQWPSYDFALIGNANFNGRHLVSDTRFPHLAFPIENQVCCFPPLSPLLSQTLASITPFGLKRLLLALLLKFLGR
eukprot:TRINITY_DN27348_c0_g1_i1.p1 TRINITY_DN27348_c0_g1~~TRINITY_DN27348_c0_g1_i1.p1  ORF type:complete len:106 (+),score=1.34 TRINITY_DN27348_c0_g1_i1:296-613(+)